jgi:hypothetical protein
MGTNVGSLDKYEVSNLSQATYNYPDRIITILSVGQLRLGLQPDRVAWSNIHVYPRPIYSTEGVPVKLYITAKEKITGVVLTQEDSGKGYVISYICHRLLDPETRYAHIEKLCLSLYYA